MPEGKTAYTIQGIPTELWEKFKKIVTKDQTMSEAIIGLIRKKVEEND